MFGRGFGWPEILLILVIVVIIFGVGRFSEVGSGLGKGIREFRSAVTGGKDEEPADETASEDKSEATSEKS